MQSARSEDSNLPFRHKKSLGQNFLTSDIVPGWLCDAAKLEGGETVLEIGPGTGRLTIELLKRGTKVIAVETDDRVIEILKETCALAINTGQLRLIKADARELDLTSFGLKDHEFKVVANIPYYLSGHLLRLLLENSIQPQTLVFLMQKELVARIARPGKKSLISLAVEAFGQPHYVRTVTRGHFHPIPNVDSAILAITAINRDNFKLVPIAFFFKILHLGLGKKRKQLLSNLSHEFARPKLEEIFTDQGLPLTIRGEDVALNTWLELAARLLQEKSYTDIYILSYF